MRRHLWDFSGTLGRERAVPGRSESWRREDRVDGGAASGARAGRNAAARAHDSPQGRRVPGSPGSRRTGTRRCVYFRSVNPGSEWPSHRAGETTDSPASPGLVRRRGLRGDRHGRARPGGRHVHRGREPLHPRHLRGLRQAGRGAGEGDQGLRAGVPAFVPNVAVASPWRWPSPSP
ncbi:hypothetical protein SHJG_7068 [Streptomyces hygroscopicus subsp. jinggangensis 5008]|nr:hypothetical protein SHJG_7068 [Streptomyces hygroscopicus subsp. jinggangensis 5008]AGF66490.1 hypothetical protein SHJGH_6828 [Streptomyces hygroscopicus subsp. jinggangensis TL01]